MSEDIYFFYKGTPYKKDNFCKSCNKQFVKLSLHLAKSSKCN